MSSTNFNMRLDEELKSNAYPVFERYGLTPSQAVKLFFNQVASTQKIPLSFDWGDFVPNEATANAIRQGRKDYENGLLTGYSPDNAEQALQEIANGQ